MKKEIDSKIKAIRSLIKAKMMKGEAVIWIITGNRFSGKTTMATRLFRDIKLFNQYIGLGAIGKTIEYYSGIKDGYERKSITNLEVFTKVLNSCIDRAYENGVNTIIEGVQIDTIALSKNNKLLGGVILSIPTSTKLKRGKNMKTRFKVVLKPSDINKREDWFYKENDKFKTINNSVKQDYCYGEILKELLEVLK